MLWFAYPNLEIDQRIREVNMMRCLQEYGNQWKLKQEKPEQQKQKKNKKWEEEAEKKQKKDKKRRKNKKEKEWQK